MIFRRKSKNLWIVIALLLGLSYCSAYRSNPRYLQAWSRYLTPTETIPVAPVAPVSIPPGWTHLFSPDGRFSVLMPKTTLKETRHRDYPISHSFEVNLDRGETFLVNYVDFPLTDLNTPDRILEDSANQPRPRLKVASKRSFGLNGHPGIEVNLHSKTTSLPYGIVRYIVVGNRVYSLWVAESSPSRAKIFFDSFRPLF